MLPFITRTLDSVFSLAKKTHTCLHGQTIPSLSRIIRQMSDQEESWRTSLSFEMLTPVLPPPPSPHTLLIKQYLFIFDSPWGSRRSLWGELPPSRFNQFPSVVWQL